MCFIVFTTILRKNVYKRNFQKVKRTHEKVLAGIFLLAGNGLAIPELVDHDKAGFRLAQTRIKTIT